MSDLITTISPTTNLPILTRPSLDLSLLPAISTQAFNSYRLSTLSQRQAIVKRALTLILEKQDVLAHELTEQMGRPIAYAKIEITTAVKRGEYLLRISGEALKDTDGEAEKGFKRYIRKEPIGPVLVLFAWNVGSHHSPDPPSLHIDMRDSYVLPSTPTSSSSTRLYPLSLLVIPLSSNPPLKPPPAPNISSPSSPPPAFPLTS